MSSSVVVVVEVWDCDCAGMGAGFRRRDVVHRTMDAMNSARRSVRNLVFIRRTIMKWSTGM